MSAYTHFACMPLAANVPEAAEGWQPADCPHCGQACWRSGQAAEAEKRYGALAVCTECALRLGADATARAERGALPVSRRPCRRLVNGRPARVEVVTLEGPAVSRKVWETFLDLRTVEGGVADKGPASPTVSIEGEPGRCGWSSYQRALP